MGGDRAREQVELHDQGFGAVKLTHLTAIPHRPERRERNARMYIYFARLLISA
jgi:hypothetical protein